MSFSAAVSANSYITELPLPGPSTWTFTATSVYSGFSGHTGVQQEGVGGLADSIYSGGNSGWANTGGADSLTADFGGQRHVTEVHIGPYDGFGYQYTNGFVLQHSDDGISWETIETISGITTGVTKMIPVDVNCRYMKVGKTGWQSLGEFWFK